MKNEVLHSQILTYMEQGWKKMKKINEYYVYLTNDDGFEIKVSKETGKIVSRKKIKRKK